MSMREKEAFPQQRVSHVHLVSSIASFRGTTRRSNIAIEGRMGDGIMGREGWQPLSYARY